jgi:hypothetical protein
MICHLVQHKNEELPKTEAWSAHMEVLHRIHIHIHIHLHNFAHTLGKSLPLK